MYCTNKKGTTVVVPNYINNLFYLETKIQINTSAYSI